MKTVQGILAFVVLLVQLLILVEGGKRACPEISNITTLVTAFSSPFVTAEPQEAAPLVLSVLFATTHHSACQCNLHEVIRGRPRLKARVNRCFGGYVVVVNAGMHRASIVCKRRGCPRIIETWDVDAKFIDCGHPEDIENGNVTFTTTTFGSTATYSCDDGYYPDQYPSRFCTQSGNWSGEVPTCLADCGPPPQIESGTASIVSTSGSVSGSRTIAAYYFCNGDARLVGNSTIDCRDDGTWEDPPMCVPLVDCGPPPQLANGRVSYFLTTLGSSARYLCNFGYNREGGGFIFCNVNGMWDQPPTCKLAE